MITFLEIITVAALLLILAASLGLIPKRCQTWFANAQIVAVWHKGRFTKLAGPAYTFAQRYLIASRDPADGQQYIQPYAAGTVPYAVVDDMTPVTDSAPSDYPLPIDILGMNEDSKRMIAAGAIAADDLVYPIPGGTVASLRTAAAGTYWVVGKCDWGTATGAGDQVNVIPCFPYQVTIAA